MKLIKTTTVTQSGTAAVRTTSYSIVLVLPEVDPLSPDNVTLLLDFSDLVRRVKVKVIQAIREDNDCMLSLKEAKAIADVCMEDYVERNIPYTRTYTCTGCRLQQYDPRMVEAWNISDPKKISCVVCTERRAATQFVR